MEHLRNLGRGDDPFVYAYYPGIDEVAHAYGLHDGYYAAELAAADRLVGDVLDVLPDDVALVVTADHGQSPCARGRLAHRWATCATSSRSARATRRFRYLHATRGGGAELVEAARDTFGREAWVLSRDELLDEGWLGPDPSPATRRRVGDVVLAAHDGIAFVDPGDCPARPTWCRRTGRSPRAEMLVPCVAGRGRA